MRVTLNGTIVCDEYASLYRRYGFVVISPSDVRNAIRDCPEGEDLILEVNSSGGSVFAGFEMYTVLRGAEVRTVAEIQSLAASAASTMMLGCDEVLISPVAQIMMHNPSIWTEGNQQAHRDSIHVLDSITESILNGYEAKSKGKKSRDELRQMMASSTWLPAHEALSAGLVDGILYGDELIPENIVNAVGNGLRALGLGGLPDPEQLRAELLASGGVGSPQEPPPVEDNKDPQPMDWRAKARLDMEKIRFI